MANHRHLAILNQGIEVWNKWREENPSVYSPDLTDHFFSHKNLSGFNLKGADFGGTDLSNANLAGANLSNASLTDAILRGTNLKGANLLGARAHHLDAQYADFRKADLATVSLTDSNLRGVNLQRADLLNANLENVDLNSANLDRANLEFANLSGADLTEANLGGADLEGVNLQGADLTNAHLEFATLVDADLTGANLTDCYVYGIAAWDLKIGYETKQNNLIITPQGISTVRVDDIEVAQFVYLLLNNEKIRNVIDTIGKKGALILGRFTKERKAVLDAIRNKLRELGYVPMMFDFEKPTQRDFTETIKTLAGLSRFIIADITNPKSSPLELQATMPDYMIPFVPIIQEDEKPFAMFQDLKQKYGEWVLDPLEYDTAQGLLDVFDEAVVAPANKMAGQLELKKAEKIRTRHVKDYKKTRPLRKTKKIAKA